MANSAVLVEICNVWPSANVQLTGAKSPANSATWPRNGSVAPMPGDGKLPCDADDVVERERRLHVAEGLIAARWRRSIRRRRQRMRVGGQLIDDERDALGCRPSTRAACVATPSELPS